jgi:D-2-hydroxyacid dehydrogenase (NADP+)
VNVGRGSAIDEEALADALEAGTIGGAALDVFDREPLPAESRLWALPNAIISPHVAGGGPHFARKARELLFENARRFTAGERLLNTVDRDRGY